MYKTINYEVHDNVAVISLNRPNQLNTIDAVMKTELNEILDKIQGDSQVRAVILWGNEKLFGAGADVLSFGSDETKSGSFASYELCIQLQALCARIEQVSKPTIAALAGYALGGSLEMALSCDIRIASENAKIGLPEVNLGTIPGAGGTQRLPRIVGVSWAKELLFTGKKISGEEAYNIGLVTHLVPEGDLFKNAMDLATCISENAPLAIAQAKDAVNVGIQLPLKFGTDYEARCSSILTGTEDQIEAGHAFKEKRKPKFTGR